MLEWTSETEYPHGPHLGYCVWCRREAVGTAECGFDGTEQHARVEHCGRIESHGYPGTFQLEGAYDWTDNGIPCPGPQHEVVHTEYEKFSVWDDHTVWAQLAWTAASLEEEVGDEVYLERHSRYGWVRSKVQLKGHNNSTLDATRLVVEVYGGTHGWT